MLQFLYDHRFDVYFGTLVLGVFGSLIFPDTILNIDMYPLMVMLNMLCALNILSHNRALLALGVILLLLCLVAALLGGGVIDPEAEIAIQLVLFGVFYGLTAFNIIAQIWLSTHVDKETIVGIMSGYISLGLVGFFTFMIIEYFSPNSFAGILVSGEDLLRRGDEMMYYAFITLMTIGYGEIVPVSPPAQKAAILVGLSGQFYVVILTAIVVGKYLRLATEEFLHPEDE